MHGHAVMGEQGVQEGAEHASVYALCAEDQRSGVVTTWGRPVRMSRTQLHRAGFRPRASSLMSLEGSMVLMAALLSMTSILT